MVLKAMRVLAWEVAIVHLLDRRHESTLFIYPRSRDGSDRSHRGE
jgi:hypothetical protein